MRKIAVLLGVSGAIAVSGVALATNTSLVKYRARHLSFAFSFSHPAEWKARFGGYVTPPYGTPQYLIVALSTERLHRPQCHTVTLPNGDSTLECNPILDSLPPEGVYIQWWFDASGSNDPKLSSTPGNVTHVDGALAKIVIDPTSKTAGWICPKDTAESVQFYIAGTQQPGSPIGRPMVYMYACTDTTNFPRFMAKLVPMLRTVSFRR
jgi:hypothetical protein